MAARSTRPVLERVASYASEYEQSILDANIESEYGYSNGRTFLQDADDWTALHYFIRFHLHADHMEVFGEPAAIALENLGESASVDGDELCEEFDRVCRAQGYTPLEREHHRLKGAVDLYTDRGDLLEWVRDEVEETGGLESVYVELTDIKWVGRKIATFFLRDAVWAWEIEEDVQEEVRMYLQPIDRWVRRTGEFLELGLEGHRLLRWRGSWLESVTSMGYRI